MADTVSVVIPAFNAEASIARTIESVLAQTVQPLEIIVVDDGSRDGTVAVAAGVSPLVRVLQKPNGGPASARNMGARMARGDWLALLDADDWWFPEKLAEQLALSGADDIGLIHCLPEHATDPVPDLITFGDLWSRNYIVNSSVLIRRSVFDGLGGFNEDKQLISVEDYNLWIRVAASRHKIATLQKKLVYYTRGVGISSNSERFMKACLYNAQSLGPELGLPSAMIRRKRADIHFEFGKGALFERRLGLARHLFWQSLRVPSARKLMYFAAALAPPALLDARRFAARFLAPAQSDARGDAPPARPSTPAQPRSPRTDDPARADAPPASRPRLVITIDAEEEFDWGKPFSRNNSSVTSMRSQLLAHRIFETYDAVPVYMVDYAVAAQDDGRRPLRELLRQGQCEIGAQLHPWINPPFVEDVSTENSYPGNLPQNLEREKLLRLTDEINAAFGIAPRIYRAGRYGFGRHTAGILKELGYQADTSAVPFWQLPSQRGSNFSATRAEPYWLDEDRTLLELPISAALIGRAERLGPGFRSMAFGRPSTAIGLPSLLARTGVLERIKLTPEGITIDEAKTLVRHMLSRGHRTFVLTYHSPSLEPGNTPYVRTQADRDRFLAWIAEFLAFFTEDIAGSCASWKDIRNACLDKTN